LFNTLLKLPDPIHCVCTIAEHFAQELFARLDGDLRVHKDTIIVTYYNAPTVESLKYHYENLPKKLEKESVDPRIPWLYNFKLDFRFQ